MRLVPASHRKCTRAMSIRQIENIVLIHRKKRILLFPCARSCTPRVRIIPLARESGTIPPFHYRARGLGHDSTPVFLPAGGLGTPVAVCHAARCLAQPRCSGTGNARPAHQAATSTLLRSPSRLWVSPTSPIVPCAGKKQRTPCSSPLCSPLRYRRPRAIDTSRHFCPHATCDYRGWLGLGNLRPNGHPNGAPGVSSTAPPATATFWRRMAPSFMANG